MQHPYRATRWTTPEKGETLVSSREEAEKLIADLEARLVRKPNRLERYRWMAARAQLYSAIGSPKMLDSAQELYKLDHNSQSCALMASALHHYGRVEEALSYYERSYRYPHEEGFSVDLSYAQSLLFKNRWPEAWAIIKRLKKRMVYAAYLPDWTGGTAPKVSVISEGGFGDIIHYSRYLSWVKEASKGEVTVYLPPYFFESGFVDLCRQQPWYPEVKLLSEAPMGVPSVGFFDLPAVYGEIPEISVPSPVWKSDCTREHPPTCGPDAPPIGFCWAARAMETPICADGVYRSLTKEQALSIVQNPHIEWVNLQKGEALADLNAPTMKSWLETAHTIECLNAVITVDTGVAHLAAAMGKPTWVLLSGAVDHKYGLHGDTTPWYPSMRLFRNDGFGFDETVRKVNNALTSLGSG